MSAERRFRICQHLKRVNPLHLVLTASSLKGLINPVLVLKYVYFLSCVQVPFQWAYLGPGSGPSVPAGCLLHPTFLQGASSHVSPSAFLPLTSRSKTSTSSQIPLPATKRLQRTRVYQSDPLSRQLAGFPISRSSALINSFVQTSSNSAKCLR